MTPSLTQRSATPALPSIKVARRGVGTQGEQFVELEITSLDGIKNTWIRTDDLTSTSTQRFAELNRLGANLILPGSRTDFLKVVRDASLLPAATLVATSVGPVRDAFVLPDSVIGDVFGIVPSLSDIPQHLRDWDHVAGSSIGWSEVCKYGHGNTRLILAFGVMLVGPLRLVCPLLEGVGMQLVAPGGSGKSVLGSVASSIWGWRSTGEVGAGETWLATVNAWEDILPARHCVGLFIDETTHAGNYADVIKAAFTIRNGAGKSRKGDAARPAWFVPFLSTSNLAAAEMLQRANSSVSRAALDRLIDIPAPGAGFGMFETLHGFGTVRELSVALLQIVTRHHGHAGRKFVACLLEKKAAGSDLDAWIAARREYFLRAVRRIIDGRQELERAAGSFATIYAALCLAKRFKVLPFTRGEACDAVRACFAAHVACTAHTLTPRAVDPVAKLRAYVMRHRGSFVNPQEPPADHVHAACPGYRFARAGRRWFGLRSETIEREVGSHEFRQVLATLNARGLLCAARGGASGKRNVTRIEILGRREYVVAVDEKAFA